MRKHTKKREGLYILLELYPIYFYLFLNISVCLELLPVRHLSDSQRHLYSEGLNAYEHEILTDRQLHSH